MRGRKATPTRLKVLKGNPGNRPLPENEPTPDTSEPEASELLAPAARRWYETLCDRLREEKRLTASHEEIIATAANRCAEIVACHETLGDEGMHYETMNQAGGVMKRAHPMVGQLNEAQRHLQSLLAELGPTPASMPKVSALKGGDGANPFRELDS
jgi:P27 family predicted phage terminase small subunit